MPREIERKFLVSGEFSRIDPPKHIRQGYAAHGNGRTVRVRTIDDNRAFLTIKANTDGVSRDEFECEIPVDDGKFMLDNVITSQIVEKYRHKVPFGGFVWEVDVFLGGNSGLIIAEIELPEAEAEFDLPEWVGAEISEDRRYTNCCLAMNPLSRTYSNLPMENLMSSSCFNKAAQGIWLGFRCIFPSGEFYSYEPTAYSPGLTTSPQAETV